MVLGVSGKRTNTKSPPALDHLVEERVSERTRILERAKRTWEGTFDAIGDPLAIVTPDLMVVRTNLAHAASANKDVRAVNGRHCFEVLLDRTEACAGCPVASALASGDMAEGEVEDARSDRVYRVRAFPMRSRDREGLVAVGEPDQAVCHYKDVTAERLLQRQLLQSEKMAAVGTLAGGVAHEINNPLGAILAFAQLAIREMESGTEPPREFLDEIETSAMRCKRIVENLLEYSRPSRGEREQVAVATLVDQALFLMRPQLAAKDIQVVSDDQPTPRVSGDANQLQQVLVNLISNAYRAMDRRGRLTIRTASEGTDRVRVTVEDDGRGIPPKHLGKIFEPFFTTRPDGRGTGLGLSISYGIVRDHGGEIRVESTEGAGTRFDVLLPAAEEEPDGRRV